MCNAYEAQTNEKIGNHKPLTKLHSLCMGMCEKLRTSINTYVANYSYNN